MESIIVGSVLEDIVSQVEAKEKKRLYMRRWYLKNRETIIKTRAIWRRKNKKKVAECQARYRKKNRDRCNQHKRKWRMNIENRYKEKLKRAKVAAEKARTKMIYLELARNIQRRIPWDFSVTDYTQWITA